MAAIKPVTFISDILTKKQIIKTDIDGNIRFVVSGTNGHGIGHVSSSYPVTASGLYINGNAYITDTIHAKRMHITEVTTSVYYEDSLSASINALEDVSASNANIGDMLQWDGTNWIASNQITGNFVGNITGNLSGTATNALDSLYANTASYALNAGNSLYANTASYALNAVTAVTALYAINAGNLIGSGTTNTIPVFTNDTSVGNSNLSLSGSTLIAGDDVVISGGLYFSSPSSMQSINPALSSLTGFYGVSDVFTAINDKFASLITNYAKLSETHIGFFNVDGTKEIELTNFTVNDLENIYLDVVIKYSGSQEYVNDLISVRMRGNIATNKVNVLLDAPTVSNGDVYRVIATKQTGSLF